MAQPVPKCAPCDGWGYQPGITPMAICAKCGGSGKPTAAPLLGGQSRG